MPPRLDNVPHKSSIGVAYPKHRDNLYKSGDLWLDSKRAVDGAEGLWRIHDDIYDLTDFVSHHPGGAEWLELTKGTDVTEAFESHHISTAAEKLLPKFQVRKAQTPRSSPYTFHDDGFYRTVRRKFREVLKNAPKGPVVTSAIYTDLLLLATFGLAGLAARFWNYGFALGAGFCLSCLAIAAHNYFHKRTNFRMHYFDLSMMQRREWRIIHVLSHHLFTNTVQDLEISTFEPILEYLPKKKSWMQRYGSWIYAPFVGCLVFFVQFLQKYAAFVFARETRQLQWTDVIPFSLPMAMYFLGGQSLLDTVGMWLVIVTFASFHFTLISFSAAHHHPDIFHDGDAPRPGGSVDWGVSQLDSVMDRFEFTGSHFLVLTNFGDHALHHLFPTLDHGTLNYLYPVFEETLKEFNLGLRMNSQMSMFAGHFQQLARIGPNPNPPDLLRKY